ncbi:MAG: lysozyme [Reyranella sp.]|nr:MAG: lysozyme [Reyranella sp.]TBR28111.1 MAG: lysozyme [Reyranella sp.]
MVTSDVGLSLIKVSEGLEQEAYPDPGNKVTGEPWTIGYGHTAGVRRGDTCTEEQASEWLRQDLGLAEAAVRTRVEVPLTQGQFDALASFIFNVGVHAFVHSTLLRLLNGGDYEGAAGQFERWINGASGPLPGLVARRAAERDLFLSQEA